MYQLNKLLLLMKKYENHMKSGNWTLCPSGRFYTTSDIDCQYIQREARYPQEAKLSLG